MKRDNNSVREMNTCYFFKVVSLIYCKQQNKTFTDAPSRMYGVRMVIVVGEVTI